MLEVCPQCGKETRLNSPGSLTDNHFEPRDTVRGERQICPDAGGFVGGPDLQPEDDEIEALQEILVEQAKEEHLLYDDNDMAKIVAKPQIERAVKQQFAKLRQSDKWTDPDFWAKVRDEAGLCELRGTDIPEGVALPTKDWDEIESGDKHLLHQDEDPFKPGTLNQDQD